MGHHGRVEPLPAPLRQGPPPPRPPAPPTTGYGRRGDDGDDHRWRPQARRPARRVDRVHPWAAARASAAELGRVTWPGTVELRSHAAAVGVLLALLIPLLLAVDAIGSAVLAWIAGEL